MVTVLGLSLATGRGLVAMWGYPLWLFLGVWIVLACGAEIDRVRLKRLVTVWALVFVAFALVFIANYAILPRYDGRYRATLYPGDRLAAEMSARFRAATGRPLAYVLGDIWTAGNIAHYAPERPRVLIGNPRRQPWIDFADIKRRGAVVVWTDGDRQTLPVAWREFGAGAQVQPPLSLPFRAGGRMLDVGWAILPPEASHAFTCSAIVRKCCRPSWMFVGDGEPIAHDQIDSGRAGCLEGAPRIG